MQNLVQNVKAELAKAVAAVTATGQSAVVDLQGFGSVFFLLVCGLITTADGSNYFTMTIEEGDESDGSDMVAITDTDRLLGTPTVINHATNFDDTIHKFGAVVGTKRYMRVKYTETGTADGIFGIVAIKGHPRHAPVA
jgi:hypothetical protein